MLAVSELVQGFVALALVVVLLAGARRRFDRRDAPAGPHDVGLD